MKIALASVALATLPVLAIAQDAALEAPAEIMKTRSPVIDLIDIDTKPERVVELVQEAGYRAKLHRMDDGQTYIDSSASGMEFQIYFDGCEDDYTECELLVFSAGFDFDQPQDENLASVWNQTKFTKAYLDDEGDPFLEFSVNILYGVTTANFEDTLVWYTSEMGEFMDHIGWNDNNDGDAARIRVTPT